jgi:hypothetical protein
LFSPIYLAMSSSSVPPKEAKVKKPSLLSRSDVDAKFLSRGVLPYMIREATGVEKMNVVEMRALLAIFEEAHERQWDVAKGPWAHAVEFYKVFFQVTLPEPEMGPREALIKDFLKRCWSALRDREAEQVTAIIDSSDTGDQALSAELGSPSLEASGDTHSTKASIVVGALPQVPSLITSTPPKPVVSTEAEEDAAYAKQVSLLAESRAKEIADLNSNIAKCESEREAALTAQRRERVLIERRERDRVAEEQFAAEKRRRLDRLGDLEHERILIPGKIDQEGGDKEREFRPLFGQRDFRGKKAFTESDRFDREREGFFNRELREGRFRDASFMSDERLSSREQGEEYDREGKPRDFNSKSEDRRGS